MWVWKAQEPCSTQTWACIPSCRLRLLCTGPWSLPSHRMAQAKEPGGASLGMSAEMAGGRGEAQGQAQPLGLGAVGLPMSPDALPPGCSLAEGFRNRWLRLSPTPALGIPKGTDSSSLFPSPIGLGEMTGIKTGP